MGAPKSRLSDDKVLQRGENAQFPCKQLPLTSPSVSKDFSVSVTQRTYVGKYLLWTQGALA